MAITIQQMKDPKFQKLRDLAIQVDNSFNGKTKGNKIIDDCEMSVFLAQVEAKGLGNEYKEFLKINKQTSNTVEVVDSTNKTPEEKFNVDKAYTKITQLEKNLEAAKTKVNNLREKLEKLENTPNYMQKYQKTGGDIAAYTVGGAGGLAIAGIAIAGAIDGEIIAIPAMMLAGVATCGAALVAGAIGVGIGTAVYYMLKSDDKEKAYNDNRNNQIEKVRKDLKDAELQVRKCELELQHFNNTL